MDIKKYLLPTEKILGLAITQHSLRASLIDKNGKIISQAVVGLEKGIVSDKEIINPEKLEKKIIELVNYIRQKNKIPLKKEIPTIVVLPTNLIFNKHFTLPNLNKKDFLSAIDLNLKLFSPIKENVLSSWQIIKKIKEDEQSIILASFIEEKNIISIEKNLRKANLLPRAIEFYSLAINRIIKEKIYKNKPAENWLTIYLNAEGLDISIALEGSVCLSFFSEWDNDNPTQKDIFSAVKRSIIQAKNYFSTNFSKEKSIEKVYLLAEGITFQKIEALKKSLESDLSIDIETPFANPVNILSLGSAIRGKTFFLEDKEISLSTLGILKEYNIYQGKIYINYWGKIFSIVSLLMLGTFLTSFLILNQISTSLENSQFLIQDNKKSQLALRLKQEANQFNSLLQKAIDLNKNTYYIDEFFGTVFNLSKRHNIKIKKILITSPNQPIKVIASSRSLEDVSNLKKSLKANSKFSHIALPATAQKQVGNEFFFEIDFKYRFK